MNSHKTGPVKRLLAALQSAWEKLSHPDSGPGREPWQIQSHYQQERDSAAAKSSRDKDLLERMSEVNGNMKLNQYVQDPAPGPSRRHGPQGTNRVRGRTPAASRQE